MNELLKVKNLHKSYWQDRKEIKVLKNISFDVSKGEMLSIVGASGAGKSTLLHILGALDEPTEGKVIFEGEDIFSRKENELAFFRNQKIGFVFQFHYLLPEFNALENVMMPLLISGIHKDDARLKAQEYLKEVDLMHRLDHKPSELSGGEQQRVAICRALVMKPALLLADELTGNLDTQNGEQIYELLHILNKKHHMTMIIVTHNELLAQKFPRCLKMVDGNLVGN